MNNETKNKILFELFKTFLATIVSALGFLIALYCNKQIDLSNERETYLKMIKAIHIEAKANEKVFIESFVSNLGKKNIVYREFSYTESEKFLGNNIFLNRASSKLIESISNYVLILKRANAFRKADEEYRTALASYYTCYRNKLNDIVPDTSTGRNLQYLKKNVDDAWLLIKDKCSSSICQINCLTN